MADNKPAAKAASTPTPTAASAPPSSGITPDPTAAAEVEAGVRSPDGGTLQHEPTPEQYPASAKVTPPAEQLNSSLSQVVGYAAPPQQGSGDLNDAVAEAANRSEELITKAREETEARYADAAKQD